MYFVKKRFLLLTNIQKLAILIQICIIYTAINYLLFHYEEGFDVEAEHSGGGNSAGVCFACQ
jgi:hypothetical protein